MATPRNLPFEVRIHFNQRDRPFTRTLRNFTDDPDAADIDETRLLEYTPCALELVALSGDPPDDARLYIDGFDALVDADDLLTDDGRVYMPCGTKVQIQGTEHVEDESGRTSTEMIYPWIPGNYRVEVRWDGRTYHTVLPVHARNVDSRQLQLMRDELERYVVGLTIDLIRKNQGIGRTDVEAALPVRFYQYQLLAEHFATIDVILQDIVRKPKHDVRRTYEVVLSQNDSRRDHRSYRWANSFEGAARNFGRMGARARYALAPQSAVYYDLPENQWVKKILENLLEITDEITLAIERHSRTAGNVADYSTQRHSERFKRIRRIQSRLRAVLTELTVRGVRSSRDPLPYTPAMQRDGRYRALYKFWWDLQNHSEVRVDASFEYQWKKTDLLWEYWTFVRTIEALKQLGFEPTSGWIFDQKWRFPERVLIPTIPDGTKVVMTRGDETIAVHYSDRLPNFRDEAEAVGSLLYVEGPHNWPDVRLDYIRAGKYEYSVVVEAKYRRARNIWRKELTRERRFWTAVMNQLQAYASDIGFVRDRRARAVEEVIALYPGDTDFEPVYQPVDGISLIQLKPGGTDDHYVEHIANILHR